MVGQLLLGLSILVGLHELGHLLAAKLFGMRVEKYSIGFPPKIFGFQWGETEYSVGAIPLGGFVKISGMIDESLDMEQMREEPKPWEFRAKPAWQRLIVMMGGIIVNIITGIVIFIALIYANGDRYLPTSEVKYGIYASELAQEIGLRTGDQIIAINGESFDQFDDVMGLDVLLGTDSYYTVRRDGRVLDIPIPNDLIEKLSDRSAREGLVVAREPFTAREVPPNSEAARAGLQAGDRIVQINEQPIQFFHEYYMMADSLKGQPVNLRVLRGNDTIPMTASFSEKGQLGFIAQPEFKRDTIFYSLAEAIPLGTERAFNVVWANIKGFAKIFRGEVSPSKAISGPVGMAEIYGSSFDWTKFWGITGFISMVLAFMNFLPIPALDGGHVMFLTYEMISGRKPSDKFLENSQKVGIVLLLGLMAFAIGNDIFKLVTNP
ncbi:regulator of sigma E protease [Catalinimonas alkaloidigena]|uniref:Zinc metalloprotease n=2 Tax=Catalinimonas alkaloidigena TaxID=1075417 RepID=A0A1G9N3T2_9BACT|nr:regulator of sigma E protease [Catalinimonas alkaloidigena]